MRYMFISSADYFMMISNPNFLFSWGWWCKLWCTEVYFFVEDFHFDTVSLVLLQVAEIIKDDLWPNPLTYFNNVSPIQASLFSLIKI